MPRVMFPRFVTGGQSFLRHKEMEFAAADGRGQNEQAATRPTENSTRPKIQENCRANKKRLGGAPSGGWIIAQTNDDVDAGNGLARRGLRQPIIIDGNARDVDKQIRAFDEKMMVIRDIRVEIGSRSVDGDLAQQACLGELIEAVVDRRERDRNP